VFMTRSLNVAPRTTEQHLIDSISKTEAEGNNNKKSALEILYVEANEQSIARPLCDSRASC